VAIMVSVKTMAKVVVEIMFANLDKNAVIDYQVFAKEITRTKM
jgi:hypothetical protein